jgi:hypothetical protein
MLYQQYGLQSAEWYSVREKCIRGESVAASFKVVSPGTSLDGLKLPSLRVEIQTWDCSIRNRSVNHLATNFGEIKRTDFLLIYSKGLYKISTEY